MPLFTIGHSNRPQEEFIELLIQNHVDAVCDVRSSPFSKYNPQYNREILKKALKKNGIDYVFLGRELGARPDNPACYADGRAEYHLIAHTDLFREGLKRVQVALKKGFRPALMCAEKDPLTCHRAILICRNLDSSDLEIVHIIDEHLNETHRAMENRMVKTLKILPDLFEDRHPNATLKRTYDIQGRKIAYLEQTPDPLLKIEEGNRG